MTIRLDPAKPGTIFLTADAEFDGPMLRAFLKAGGKLVSNGYRVAYKEKKDAR